MYRSAYAKIREDPTAKPKPKKEITPKRYRKILSLMHLLYVCADQGILPGDNYKALLIMVVQGKAEDEG